MLDQPSVAVLAVLSFKASLIDQTPLALLFPVLQHSDSTIAQLTHEAHYPQLPHALLYQPLTMLDRDVAHRYRAVGLGEPGDILLYTFFAM